jgi:hypothetical protein
MNTFNVRFMDNGTTEHVRRCKAISAGQAFQKCLEECPGARLIGAWREGRYADGYGITRYEPPSIVKVETEPAPKVEQLKLNLSPPGS